MFRKILDIILVALIALAILATGAFAAGNYEDIDFVYNGVTYTIRYHFNGTYYERIHAMPESYEENSIYFDDYTDEYSGYLKAEDQALEAFLTRVGIPSLGDNSTPVWVWGSAAGCIGGLIVLVHRKRRIVTMAESKALPN